MKVDLKPGEREGLLAYRDGLVGQARVLRGSAPPTSAPAYKHRFYQEDMQTLLRKILQIDRKLGRV